MVLNEAIHAYRFLEQNKKLQLTDQFLYLEIDKHYSQPSEFLPNPMFSVVARGDDKSLDVADLHAFIVSWVRQ